MATVAVPPPIDRQKAERRFYSGMALLLMAVVFIGFAPSFYLRDIVPAYPRPNPTLPPSVILHGSLFTLWMVALIVQTQLVAAGRRDVHMKLGAATMLLAIALVPMMYLASVWQVARANQPPFTDPLSWTAIPLGSIPPFAWLVWKAWDRRREPQWHKRLMIGAAIIAVAGPGFGRIPMVPPSFWGFSFQMVLAVVLLFAPMFVWDRRSMGRVHPATWTGFGLALASAVIPLALIGTGTWAPIAQHLPGVGR